MTNNRGQQIIALEEHNSDQGLLELPAEQGGRSHSGPTLDRLMDIDEQRIKKMEVMQLHTTCKLKIRHSFSTSYRVDTIEWE